MHCYAVAKMFWSLTDRDKSNTKLYLHHLRLDLQHILWLLSFLILITVLLMTPLNEH